MSLQYFISLFLSINECWIPGQVYSSIESFLYDQLFFLNSLIVSVPVIRSILFSFFNSLTLMGSWKQKKPFFFTRLPKEELKLNILSCGARGSTRGHEKASTQEGSSGKTSHCQKRYCKYPPVILVIHFYIICT